VAELAVTIGGRLQVREPEVRDLRRAALLHDIGKLGVSTLILDKPDRLTERERAEIRVHPAYTQRILERVTAFASIVKVASAHHERLDGKGYHLGLPAERLSPMSRALAVADVYEALTAERPYRRGLPRNEAMAILRGLSGTALCTESVEALAAEAD
jgi:HD-GYP domain-containing protein (c-di-GMP phosphodiesterase class II)